MEVDMCACVRIYLSIDVGVDLENWGGGLCGECGDRCGTFLGDPSGNLYGTHVGNDVDIATEIDV